MTAEEILTYLRRRGSQRNVEGMARYGIVADDVVGVDVGTLRALGKKAGRDHALALALWQSGVYEARMLTAFVDKPDRVTPAQMDRWASDFDNWAICDALTFHLFDKTPHAWSKVRQWSTRHEEFVKRAAFALLAALALHDRRSPDAPFKQSLRLIERAASDDRNFVKKGVSWALRSIGGRSPALNAASIRLATRLSKSADAGERWVGKDVLRDITRPLVKKRSSARDRKRTMRSR